MSNVETLYQQAQLALAAYSTLSSGMNELAYIDALQQNGQGMSQAQAAHFAATYTVVGQYQNPANGLSVTLFQNNQTQEFNLAIAGTDDLKDLLTDVVDISLLGTNKLQAQYASLKTQLDIWRNGPLKNQTFTVTGHSLGGFLATGIAADYASQVSHTYLYNSPGVGGLVSSVLGALGVIDPLPDPSLVSNIKSNAGPNIIAGLGTQVSSIIPVEMEDRTAPGIIDRPAAFNHSQRALTDALAVHAIYAQIAPNLTQADLNALIDASSPEMQRIKKKFGFSESNPQWGIAA